MLSQTSNHQATSLFILPSALCPYTLPLCWMLPTSFPSSYPHTLLIPCYYSIPVATILHIPILLLFSHSTKGWAQNWKENTKVLLEIKGESHQKLGGQCHPLSGLIVVKYTLPQLKIRGSGPECFTKKALQGVDPDQQHQWGHAATITQWRRVKAKESAVLLGVRMGDELGHWDCHVYTIDTMCDFNRASQVAQW